MTLLKLAHAIEKESGFAHTKKKSACSVFLLQFS